MLLSRLFYLVSLMYRYDAVSLTSCFQSGILFPEVTEDEIDKSPLLDFGVRTYCH